jgi:DNA-binding NarL/FixJ family response regulator
VYPVSSDVQTASILAVDDHSAARAWLRSAVAATFPGTPIQEAATCAQALLALHDHRLSLVLLDLGLPDGNGLSVLDELRRIQPDCPCVITTVFDDDEHVFSALRAGAAGYILKDQSQHELGDLLRQMLDGRPPLSPGIARRMLHHFSTAPVASTPVPVDPALASAQPADSLTGRELDVLRIVAKGLSIREAAEMLEISPHTVHTHVRTVYRKLAVGTRAEAALAASRLGLV